VLELSPESAAAEEDVGTASLEAGRIDEAASHLERALELDPLRLSAATALETAYRKRGDAERADALARRMRQAMRGSPKIAR
jgi:Tfp pilus assembly protein PilF